VELENTMSGLIAEVDTESTSFPGAQNSLIKNVLDFAFAGILVALLTPLFLMISALIKIDGGPVIFSQSRVGRNNSRFQCFKFRSMILNGDEVLKAKLESDPRAAAEWSEMRKLKNDPRVTKFGRILRATSLDELPQLINVLRQEMSFVGPRPIVECEIERYGKDISFYYKTRPGITGLWQVSGRSNISFAERVRLDVKYIRNWSLLDDLFILFRTVPAVIRRRGAF
jgi:Undecaprenyl-phosphate galactose phosphotransferase WbaP